ncbi:MAG TPA: glycosyltransferase family 4 protein [bacterium]
MPHAVALFVNEYAPQWEGVARSARVLWTHLRRRQEFDVTMQGWVGGAAWRREPGRLLYGRLLRPAGALAVLALDRRVRLRHVYGSLTGRWYLRLLRREPLIVTNAAGFVESNLASSRSGWARVTAAVVECARDAARLTAWGMPASRIHLIYPGLDADAFRAPEPPSDGPFRIGFSSAPLAAGERALASRGVDLLVAAARARPDIEVVLLWRGRSLRALRRMLGSHPPGNVTVVDRIIARAAEYYGTLHAAVLASRSVQDCKPCPNSVMESLAAGRPVAVSSAVGVADLIRERGCGVVFEPELDGLLEAVDRLRSDYARLRAASRPAAEASFGAERFAGAYAALYGRLLETGHGGA